MEDVIFDAHYNQARSIVEKDCTTIKCDSNDKPRFSIIMATYNRAHLINRAIASVLGQNYPNFELIIIDDGSTDGTAELINSTYRTELDDGIIVYKRINKTGVSRARNEGLLLAKYEWVGYLDTDNIMCKNYFEIFAYYITNNHDKKTFNAKLINIFSKKVIGREYNEDRIKVGNIIDLGCYVHNISLFHTAGGFDEKMNRLVDWDIITKYSLLNSPYFINEIVLYYDDGDSLDRITNGTNNLYQNENYYRSKYCEYPTVSTVIVAYNHEKYIGHAIESALSQRGEFIHEIIISDDGSTDSTREIIEKYEKEYPLLIKNISSNNNKGISDNYKRCFENASGKYIAILEGDDFWRLPNKLQCQIDYLENNADCSMVFSDILLLEDGAYRKHKNIALPEKLIGEDLIKYGISLIANFSCCMYRTEIIKSLPECIYTDRISEVAVAFYFERYGKIGFINKELSVYRISQTGVWSGASEKQKLIQQINVRENVLNVCSKIYKDKIVEMIENLSNQVNALDENKKKELELQEVLLKRSIYFNSLWYKDKYDLDSSVDPVQDYLCDYTNFKSPSDSFNEHEYLEINRKVKNMKGLVHYERYGKQEKRCISFGELQEKYFPISERQLLIGNDQTIYFSIIVTSYNYEQYILECLKSIIAQDYREFEIIIIDDGSKDNSVCLIEHFIEEHVDANIPIRLLYHENNENKGLAESIKLGILNAKGNYIAFCESDDRWTDNHLSELKRYIEISNLQAEIIVNDVDVFGEDEDTYRLLNLRKKRDDFFDLMVKKITPEQFRKTNYILTMSATCVKRTALLECDFNVVGSPECIDWWLWRQICYKSPVMYLAKKITLWRAHESYMKKTRKKFRITLIEENRLFLEAGDEVLNERYGYKREIPNIKNGELEDKIKSIEEKYIVMINDLQKKNKDLNTMFADVNNSNSELRRSLTYKIGRTITFFPRLIRHVFSKKPM